MDVDLPCRRLVTLCAIDVVVREMVNRVYVDCEYGRVSVDTESNVSSSVCRQGFETGCVQELLVLFHWSESVHSYSRWRQPTAKCGCIRFH